MQASALQARFERIRSNKLFEVFVISVIILSALLVGAKTYHLPKAVNAITVFFDWFITLFFLTEILIRFMAAEHKRTFFNSFWNWFDSLIVFVSMIPADNAEMAVIARLVRVFRVLRMISIIQIDYTYCKTYRSNNLAQALRYDDILHVVLYDFSHIAWIYAKETISQNEDHIPSHKPLA